MELYGRVNRIEVCVSRMPRKWHHLRAAILVPLAAALSMMWRMHLTSDANAGRDHDITHRASPKLKRTVAKVPRVPLRLGQVTSTILAASRHQPDTNRNRITTDEISVTH